jgi:metal-responsive CopG/Arc/MetJ family transcriptional regulator
MLPAMTAKKPAGEKIAVNARIDIELIAKLDDLGKREGTVQFQRSRSELVGFAVREYVDRHGAKPARK